MHFAPESELLMLSSYILINLPVLSQTYCIKYEAVINHDNPLSNNDNIHSEAR